jgi:hypothetical protein
MLSPRGGFGVSADVVVAGSSGGCCRWTNTRAHDRDERERDEHERDERDERDERTLMADTAARRGARV